MTEVAVKDGLNAALLAVQAASPTLPKEKTATVKSEKGSYEYHYVSLDTIVETIGPLLAEHKLIWTTLPGVDPNGQPALEYRLIHVPTGEVLTGFMPLLLTKSDPQGMGSALTYARRYSMCAVLNLVADDDDDGQSASSPAKQGEFFPASEPQQKLVKTLVTQKHASRDQLRVMLDEIGATDVQLEEGWTAKLSGGRDGTASALITWLKERPLPDTEHPSDVPSDPAEFEQPSLEGEPVPFDNGDAA